MRAAHVVAKIIRLCTTNFCCELVLVLSKVPSERGRAQFHNDTKNKTNGAKIVHRRDGEVFRRLWLMPCSN